MKGKRNNMKIKYNKKWVVYMLRWQFSGWVMLPFMLFLQATLPLWANLMVGSFFGGAIFWYIDKRIFHHTPISKGEDEETNKKD